MVTFLETKTCIRDTHQFCATSLEFAHEIIKLDLYLRIGSKNGFLINDAHRSNADESPSRSLSFARRPVVRQLL